MLKNFITRDEEGYIVRCPKCNSGDLVKRGHRELVDGSSKQRYLCNQCKWSGSTVLKLDEELVRSNVQYKKQQQRFQDSNRIIRKSFIEYARIENALSELNKALIQRLDIIDLSPKTIRHLTSNSKNAPIGLIQLSDLHMNELVHKTHSLNNLFDFNIASKRLRLFAIKAKSYLKSLGVEKVVLAMTGDLINSDRRIDELLHMATNRADASLLAVYLLSQFIIDLNKDLNIQVINVSGNESRMTENLEMSELLARDNYDWIIYNFLNREFRNSEGIKFMSKLDARQNVVNINGQNVLILHGEKIPMESGIEKSIIRLIGQWSAKGVEINFVIFGHYHSARLADTYGRSSSLVGANTYSEDALQLVSLASQNAYIFYDNGERDCIRFGLQNIKDVEGYDIIEELVAYNAKSTNKLKDRKTILEVVV